ncbi:MAG: 4-alpha-glucanotransferase, partial [Candidatus Hydrogenedentales bacterium]
MTAAAAKERAGLHALADAYGLKRSYLDNEGKRRSASPEAIVAVLQALGAPIATTADAPDALAQLKEQQAARWLEPILLGQQGRKLSARLNTPPGATQKVQYRLTQEHGETHEGSLDSPVGVAASPSRNGRPHRPTRVTIDQRLPLGYHDLTVYAGGDEQKSTIIVAPPACRPIAGDDKSNRWGAFLPLYAFRKKGNWGTGDYSDLGTMLTWLQEYGADLVGTLPLLAAFLEENACDPSPYSPVSRMFWNEL